MVLVAAAAATAKFGGMGGGGKGIPGRAIRGSQFISY